MATTVDFLNWLEDLLRNRGGAEKSAEIVENDREGARVHIYTDTNYYAINSRDPVPGGKRGDGSPDHGYLGCIASCRKPRAGESRTRGNDLADGPLSLETWHAILADIVAYELVKVHRPPSANAGQEILGPDLPAPAAAA